MSLARAWGNPAPFRPVLKPVKELRGVYQLKRPKSLAEVNHWQQTPYTRRVCTRCRKQLYYHWYLVFLDPVKCSKLYCSRDGLGYFTKERYK